MSSALVPRGLNILTKLPRKEPLAQRRGHRLVRFGALVVAEPVVGKAQRLGQLPSVAVVQREEFLETERLQLMERNQRQHRVPQLRSLLLINPPETFRVQTSGKAV